MFTEGPAGPRSWVRRWRRRKGHFEPAPRHEVSSRDGHTGDAEKQSTERMTEAAPRRRDQKNTQTTDAKQKSVSITRKAEKKNYLGVFVRLLGGRDRPLFWKGG